MKYDKKELCLIWLDSFLGLEYKFKRELLSLIEEKPDIPTLLETTKDYLTTSVGESEYRTLKLSANREYLEKLLLDYQNKGVKIVTILSNDYPKAFNDIECPPLVIYYKGDLSLFKQELFAIVGSRKSLPSALAVAKNYTEEIIDAGFVPVTGIAEGVDSKVLTTALEKNGKAISIVAGGLDHIYPANHAELVDKITENGLVISEYPPSTVPKPFNFPVRNRLISALARGVLVVSAGLKSGTMYTAGYAVEYSKDLFAVPYGVGVPSGAGCNELIKKGALLTDTPKDILDFYGKKKEKKVQQFSSEELEIINTLSNGAQHIEKICATLNKRVFEITPLLSILEIKGFVSKSGNVYQLTRNDLEA